MFGLILLGAIPGVILGTRFRVTVLLPGTLVAALAGLVTGLLSDESLGRALLDALVVGLALEAGYVVGSLTASVLWQRLPAGPQMSRARAAGSQAAAPASDPPTS